MLPSAHNIDCQRFMTASHGPSVDDPDSKAKEPDKWAQAPASCGDTAVEGSEHEPTSIQPRTTDADEE